MVRSNGNEFHLAEYFANLKKKFRRNFRKLRLLGTANK
jgi:hypothetical protein